MARIKKSCPIQSWMTYDGTQLRVDNVEPWSDAVCSFWDNPARYRGFSKGADDR